MLNDEWLRNMLAVTGMLKWVSILFCFPPRPRWWLMSNIWLSLGVYLNMYTLISCLGIPYSESPCLFEDRKEDKKKYLKLKGTKHKNQHPHLRANTTITELCMCWVPCRIKYWFQMFLWQRNIACFNTVIWKGKSIRANHQVWWITWTRNNLHYIIMNVICISLTQRKSICA